jgi:hypothetical protein
MTAVSSHLIYRPRYWHYHQVSVTLPSFNPPLIQSSASDRTRILQFNTTINDVALKLAIKYTNKRTSLNKNYKKSKMFAWRPVLKDLLVPSLVMVIGGFTLGTTAIVSALTATTTVSSNIGGVISLFTTSGTVNANVTPTGSGAQTIASDTVTVSTNDPSGYTLALAETGASSNLVSGSDTIPPSSGTQASPVAMSANTWGYRVDGVGGFGAGPTSGQSSAAISGSIKFAAVPVTASPNTLKTTSGTASSDTTTVWYGVAANTSQPIGTYTNSVTYTATAN